MCGVICHQMLTEGSVKGGFGFYGNVVWSFLCFLIFVFVLNVKGPRVVQGMRSASFYK